MVLHKETKQILGIWLLNNAVSILPTIYIYQGVNEIFKEARSNGVIVQDIPLIQPIQIIALAIFALLIYFINKRSKVAAWIYAVLASFGILGILETVSTLRTLSDDLSEGSRISAEGTERFLELINIMNVTLLAAAAIGAVMIFFVVKAAIKFGKEKKEMALVQTTNNAEVVEEAK